MKEAPAITKPSVDSKSSSPALGQTKPLSFFKPFIQAKLTINQPNDQYEQEADSVAEKVMRMTDQDTVQTKFFKPAIQRKCAHCEGEEKIKRKESTGGNVTADASLGSYVDSLGSSGRSLSNDIRSFYEPRLGYDFSNVKVHTDTSAAESARSVNALAYTSGNNIVFGNGQYSPDTDSGKKLLAHELTHVVQQNGPSVISRQLDPSLCSSDCTAPDNSTGPKDKFTLDVYADKEGPFLLIPATHDVGHSWVRLTDKSGNVWTYGFWPQTGFDAANISQDVEGCVHHPDYAHQPSASQTFELTEEEFNAAKAKAVDLCNTKPKYNLFGLQCTTFVRHVMGAANKSPAGGFGLIWDSPNALASWMKTNSLLLGFKATHTSASGSNDTTLSLGAEATYTRQFYSLLGNKIRLEWMSGVELGSKVQSVSTGVGIEFNPQKIFLPSAYVFGGVTGGNLGGPSGEAGVGFRAGAGLNYNIDEIGFVRVEYDFVRDMVSKDSELQQMSISAGLKF